MDILTQTSFGTDVDRFIGGLNLPITDPETNSPVYYINVVAVNGAGMQSSIETSRLHTILVFMSLYCLSLYNLYIIPYAFNFSMTK